MRTAALVLASVRMVRERRLSQGAAVSLFVEALVVTVTELTGLDAPEMTVPHAPLTRGPLQDLKPCRGAELFHRTKGNTMYPMMAPEDYPHGVVTDEKGVRTLYVNEYKVRSIDHANRLRGLRADQVCVFKDWGMPQRVREYLEQEVLAPLYESMRQENENPGQRKMREAGSIYAKDAEGESDIDYLKRFAHTLEARMHDLERHAYAGELPRAVPDHQSADWGLMVVKRLEAIEEWRKQCATAVIPWLADVPENLAKTAQRLNAIEIWKNDTLAKSLGAITETLEKHAQYMQGTTPISVVREEFAANLEQASNRYIGLHNDLASQLSAVRERLDVLGEPTQNIDEAFEQWRASDWDDEEIKGFFGYANSAVHRQLSLVMEQSFRDGFNLGRKR